MREIEKLAEILKGYGSLAVAFSGGVDSTCLAAAAKEVLGEGNILLVHVRSPFSIIAESEFAEIWAKENGFRIEIVETDPIKVDDIRKNDEKRCYHCKKFLMGEARKTAESHGIAIVADGTNIDDYGDYRPGMKAAKELDIKHPLAESGFTKEKVRKYSKILGLPNHDFPPNACLASRVPYHLPLDHGKLEKIAKAEDFLHSLGYRGCRVRWLDGDAKIELNSGDTAKAVEKRTEIVRTMKSIGFKGVYLDLEGYRTGSLNPGS